MAKIVIRPATRVDAPQIARLWEQLVVYHRDLDQDLPQSAVDGGDIYVQRLMSRDDDPNTQVLVAAENGRVIGYVLGVVIDLVPEMFLPEMSGFLADIFVETGYRGQGVGRALVDGLQDWFRSKGLRHFEWYVAARNENGRLFWKEMGGREVMVRMRANL